MEISDADRIKHRRIRFTDLHPNPEQSARAAAFLAEVPGILSLDPVTPVQLALSYDLQYITLQEIEQALREIGLHLEDHLMHRIRRAVVHYAEQTFLANCDCPRGTSSDTQQIFAKRYAKLNHSLRDQRPEHWRRYL